MNGDHNVQIQGVWHNDNTAGVAAWCETCEVDLLDADDEVSFEQLARVVLTHQVDEARPEQCRSADPSPRGPGFLLADAEGGATT